MAFVVPNEGDLKLLGELLGAGEDWSLGLYVSPVVPNPKDVAATYTAREASFAGYERKTVRRAVGDDAWAIVGVGPASGDEPWTDREVAKAQYSHPMRWVASDRATIYGYFMVGVESGVLILAEAFEPRTLCAGDTLSITPVFEVA